MKRILASRELLLLIAIGLVLGIISSRFPAFIGPSNLAAVFNDTFDKDENYEIDES